MKTTKKNYKEVLNNFINYLGEQEDDYLEIFLQDIDDMLDKILADDGFGTEGQCDPRGDRRDIY